MKRLSTKRLLAVIDACSRGIDEWEFEIEDEYSDTEPTNQRIKDATAGLQCLYAIINKRLIKEKGQQ